MIREWVVHEPLRKKRSNSVKFHLILLLQECYWKAKQMTYNLRTSVNKFRYKQTWVWRLESCIRWHRWAQSRTLLFGHHLWPHCSCRKLQLSQTILECYLPSPGDLRAGVIDKHHFFTLYPFNNNYAGHQNMPSLWEIFERNKEKWHENKKG